MKCWNDFTKEWCEFPTTPTLHNLREPARYWVVTDAQLARDLKPRTLKTVYAENRALRGVERRYVPNNFSGGGLGMGTDPEAEYLAWCKAKGHTPHPASLDPDHPINRWREKCPPRETVKDEPTVEWREAAD